MLYVLLLRALKAWKFENFQVNFLTVFPQKTIVFHWKQFKIRFLSFFCSALFDSFKALLGCSEKIEFLAKRLGL